VDAAEPKTSNKSQIAMKKRSARQRSVHQEIRERMAKLDTERAMAMPIAHGGESRQKDRSDRQTLFGEVTESA
jgi:hypothetical protein